MSKSSLFIIYILESKQLNRENRYTRDWDSPRIAQSWPMMSPMLFHENYCPFVSDTFFTHVSDFGVLFALNKTECSIVSSFPIQNKRVVVCNQSRSQRLAVCSDQVAHSSKSGSGNHYHSFSNSKSLSGGLLFGNSGLWFVTLLHFSALLSAVELDMAVGSEVWTNATVSTVGSSASLDCSLDHDVVDHALFNIQPLSLSIGLQVNE